MINNVDWNKEIYLYDTITADEVIGKYAYNKRHDHGGIITDVSERGLTLVGSYHPTLTGDCVFDSLCINGYKVFELIKNNK